MKAYLIRKIYVVHAENEKELKNKLVELKEENVYKTEVWADVEQDINDPDFTALLDSIKGEGVIG